MRRGVWTIVVAGGSGSRFGRPKQFDLLMGRPVVAWSVDAARGVSEGVVLVLPAASVAPVRLTAPASAGPAGPGPVVTGPDGAGRFGADVVVPGGDSRSASVRAGLAAVPDDAEVIVVHDAARPLAGIDLFEAVVARLLDAEQCPDGVICAVPVADTLKRVGPDGAVSATVDRAELVAVQTPQAFSAVSLRRAHADGGEATDDAAMVEAAGGDVRVVAGDPRNVKLTTPADLPLLEYLLSGRS